MIGSLIQFGLALVWGPESIYPECAAEVVDALANEHAAEYAATRCPDEMAMGCNAKTEARQDCHRYAQEWREAA